MRLRQLDLSHQPVHAGYQALGLPPLEIAMAASGTQPARRVAQRAVPGAAIRSLIGWRAFA